MPLHTCFAASTLPRSTSHLRAVLDWPGDEGDTSQRQSVASGAKYVEKLNEEFSKRAPMFQDDALFIRSASVLRLALGHRCCLDTSHG